MSKYKVGDKFIIEIEEVLVKGYKGGCYKAKGLSLCFLADELDKLEKVSVATENTSTDGISVPDTWEEDGTRSKTTGLIVAPENYEEGDKKHFTWDEAMEVEKKLKGTGWRLPTAKEWGLLAYEFGWDEEENALDSEALKENLKLPATGHVCGGRQYNATTSGNYWTRTATSDAGYAYQLHYDGSAVWPQDDAGKDFGFAVRLVKEVE